MTRWSRIRIGAQGAGGIAMATLILAAPARSQWVAEQITEQNASERLFGGTDADGGIGDWYLSNGVVEAIVDEVGVQSDLPGGVTPPPKQSEAAVTGGGILDLGLVGADNDQLNQLFTVGGLSTETFLVYDTVQASVEGSKATVTVSGVLPGFEGLAPTELPVVTEYSLAGSDRYLTLRTTVTNQGEVGAGLLGGFLDVMPWTTRAAVPFSPFPGLGFNHEGLDPSDPFGSLERVLFAAGPGNAGPGDGIMDPESGGVTGEASYGLLGVEVSLDPDGPGPDPGQTRAVNEMFGVSSVDATAFGNLPFFELPPGGVLTYERRLYVGARNDVASVANAMIPELGERVGFGTGTLSGDVDGAESPEVRASVVVTRTSGPAIRRLPDGSPVTHFRTDAWGHFEGVVVPEGTYDLEFRAAERDPLVVSGVMVGDGEDALVSVPPLSGVGTLVLRVSETRLRSLTLYQQILIQLFAFLRSGTPMTIQENPFYGRPVPAKVTIEGIGETPNPRFAWDLEALEMTTAGARDLRPETFGGALAQANFVYLPHGDARVQIRPGEYQLWASRGPEYDVDRAVVSVGPGETVEVSLEVQHLLETPDALSADFHIHSARSLDSSAGPAGRVASFAGEGVEVMVSSDHDFVLDYGPVIEDLDLDAWVTSIVGEEVTSTVGNPPAFPDAVGHLNGWPLRADATARKDGAIEDEYVAPNFLFTRLRRAGAEVIQYNHLRAGVRGLGSIGFFNSIGCNRCENAIDTVCSEDADCPVTPAPQLCTCVGYQPDRPLTDPPNDVLLDDDVTGTSGVPNPDGFRNIDFDVMELANGLNISGFLELRDDWFSLLNQAYGSTARGPIPFLPATGVSDSHRNTLESAGYFRTYVMGVGDEITALDRAKFDASVRAGRMVGTTGPWIEFEIVDQEEASAGLGETLVPSSATVTLRIRVLASSWIPVQEVRVIANGRERSDLVFDYTTRPRVWRPLGVAWQTGKAWVERFRAEIPVTLDEDTWLLVEAGVPLDPPPPAEGLASRIVPGMLPHAFTNPIFVDLDGDGFDPPGVRSGGGGPLLQAAPESEHRNHDHPHPHGRFRGFRIDPQALTELLGR